jgi:mycothiol synthase
VADSPYNLRNFRPGDLESYLSLASEAEECDGGGRPASATILRECLHRPNHVPERDLFVAQLGDSLVGYLDITPETGIRRAVLDCAVHPDHRRRGLATGLCQLALSRAADMGATIAHASAGQENVAAATLLDKLGFKVVRRQLEMRLAMSEVGSPDSGRAAPRLRRLERGEEKTLAELQNRCFAGSWGFNPNTAEDIAHRLNLSDSSPGDVVLACEGDRAVAYCWTTLPGRTDPGQPAHRGRIHMMGVDPEYQGKGMGRAVLLAGLAHLRSEGVEWAELTVDSGNGVACTLYESVGFRVSSSTIWYEKTLR